MVFLGFITMPKVSIIVSIYNTARYLIRCLDSINSQSLDDIEVILVNDGSTDESKTLCENYILSKELKWKLYTKDNGGLSSARRYGWERANGNYIVFIDSDDALHCDYCRLMYDAIQSSDSQLAICGYNLCDSTSIKIYLPQYDKTIIEDILNNYCRRLILNTNTVPRLPGFLWMRMMRRDLISEKCFLNENLVFAEDQIFDLNYSQSINRIVVVSKPLYNYYINPGSLTLKYRPNMLDMMLNLHKYYYNFLASNNLLDEDAIVIIQKNLVEGIIAALVNSIRFGKLSKTWQLMKRIRTNVEYRCTFENLASSSNLNSTQNIWWFFIKNRIIFIPYIYYNLRYRNS